jgi:hypothetical protein
VTVCLFRATKNIIRPKLGQVGILLAFRCFSTGSPSTEKIQAAQTTEVSPTRLNVPAFTGNGVGPMPTDVTLKYIEGKAIVAKQ